MVKTKNKNTTNIVKSLLPYLLIGIVVYSPWMFLFYATGFQIPFILKYIGGVQGILYSTIVLILVYILMAFLRKKEKNNIYLSISILLNVGLLSLFIFYYASPFLDYVVINKSLTRFCQISDPPSFSKQCNKLLEDWKLPLPLSDEEIKDWELQTEDIGQMGKIYFKVPPQAKFEKSNHSGHPNFGVLKGLPTFPTCINMSLFYDGASMDEAIDQGASGWGDQSLMNYKVDYAFANDNKLKERIIERNGHKYLDAIVLLGNKSGDNSQKMYLYADSCEFSDDQLFRTFIRNISK